MLLSTGSLKFRQLEPDGANGEIYSPPRPPKPKVPEPVKRDVETRAHAFIASVLKPKHLTPAPQDADVNDLVDISTKWYRNYFSNSRS